MHLRRWALQQVGSTKTGHYRAPPAGPGSGASRPATGAQIVATAGDNRLRRQHQHRFDIDLRRQGRQRRKILTPPQSARTWLIRWSPFTVCRGWFQISKYRDGPRVPVLRAVLGECLSMRSGPGLGPVSLVSASWPSRRMSRGISASCRGSLTTWGYPAPRVCRQGAGAIAGPHIRIRSGCRLAIASRL